MKKNCEKVCFFLNIFLLCIAFSSGAFAFNGAQVIGPTAITKGMGGAGASAFPQDIGVIVTNPAGLAFVPRQADFNLLIGTASIEMNSTANPAAGTVKSNFDPIFLPSAGVALPISDSFYMGFGIFSVAGFGVDYPVSRSHPLLTDNLFDTHSDYGLLKFVASGAYKINEKFSVGGGFHFDVSRFEINAINPLTLQETSGMDRNDTSFGVGGSIGILYQPIKMLRIGASYTTEQFFNGMERYQDILPNGLNFPQQVNFGLSVTPIDKLTIATDFRWVNWSGAKGGFGDPLASGGLGWRDQYIAMIGLQYQPWKPIIFRLGYNFGRSPIGPEAVYVNALSSVVEEHHLGIGLGLRLTKRLDVDLSYVRDFRHRQVDNGTFPGTVLAGGAGSTTALSSNQFDLQLGVHF